jgi:hypothetical protein
LEEKHSLCVFLLLFFKAVGEGKYLVVGEGADGIRTNSLSQHPIKDLPSQKSDFVLAANSPFYSKHKRNVILHMDRSCNCLYKYHHSTTKRILFFGSHIKYYLV